MFWSRFWQLALAAGWRVSQLPGLWRWFQVEAGYNPMAHVEVPGGVRGRRLRAADLWASLDAEDGGYPPPSYVWPEVGGRIAASVTMTMQLYWPATDPEQYAVLRGLPLRAASVGGELEGDR